MEATVMEISATLESAGGLGQGKLRVTTERLVFERRKLFGGAGDVTSFSLGSIQAASISGLMDKKLRVRAGSTELVFRAGITSNGDGQLKAISDLLQRAIAGQPLSSNPPPPAPSAPSPATTNPTQWIDELERLTQLRDSGALTPDEFAAAKAKLLAS